RDRLAARDARRGRRRTVRFRPGSKGPGPAHLRPLRRAETEGVGRVPGPALRVGAPEVLVSPLAKRDDCTWFCLLALRPGRTQLTADCEPLLDARLVVVLAGGNAWRALALDRSIDSRRGRSSTRGCA